MTIAKYLILIATMFSVTVLATVFAKDKPPVLVCSANGFALAKMSVEEIAGVGVINITFSEADDAPVFSFPVMSGFKDLKSGDSATLVGQKEGLTANHRVYDDAVMLRVVEGQKRAFLAVKGSVYLLECF